MLAFPVREQDVASLIEHQTRRRLAGTSNREGHLAFFQATHVSQVHDEDASKEGSASTAAEASNSNSSGGESSPSSSERHKKYPRRVSPSAAGDGALASGAAGDSSSSSSTSLSTSTIGDHSTTAESAASANQGIATQEQHSSWSTTPWREALVRLGGVHFAPGANKSHVAMRQRQVDLNLEEKVAALKGKQKHRRELHGAYRGTASAEQEQPQSAAEAMEAAERDREFFLAMRNEGNM